MMASFVYFQSLEVVDRGSETQLQVTENAMTAKFRTLAGPVLSQCWDII